MKKYNINTIEEFKLNAVGADVSVRLRKNQNRNNIRIFDKHKSNVVGETSLGDPKEKYKFANKPLSNNQTSNIKHQIPNLQFRYHSNCLNNNNHCIINFGRRNPKHGNGRKRTIWKSK